MATLVSFIPPQSQRPLNFTIPVRGRQNNDAGLGKLTTNGDEHVRAVGAGKAEIHQRDVRSMTAKFFQSLHTIGRLGNQEHVQTAPGCGQASGSFDCRLLDEREDVRIDHVGIRGHQAVRQARINLERGMLEQLGLQQ